MEEVNVDAIASPAHHHHRSHHSSHQQLSGTLTGTSTGTLSGGGVSGGVGDMTAVHNELLWVKANLNEKELELAELREQHLSLVKQSEQARVNWEEALTSKDRAIEQMEAAIVAQDRSIKKQQEVESVRQSAESVDPSNSLPTPTPGGADANVSNVNNSNNALADVLTASLAHPLLDDLRTRLSAAEKSAEKYKTAAHSYRKRAKAAEAENQALRQLMVSAGMNVAGHGHEPAASVPLPTTHTPAVRQSAPAGPVSTPSPAYDASDAALRERCVLLEKQLGSTSAREQAARRALADAARVQREVKRLLLKINSSDSDTTTTT
ncbi:hypothetical protein NFJ02_36g90590 [Pycnococcus provasolii]